MPLPDAEARQALIEYKLKSGAKYEIEAEEMAKLMDLSEGYSCADLNFIVKEAAMTPIREMATEDLMKMKDTDALRPIMLDDFQKVLAAN
jgi:SpoVK/Ycf46/Vps4 family AAA+-type ATPase